MFETEKIIIECNWIALTRLPIQRDSFRRTVCIKSSNIELIDDSGDYRMVTLESGNEVRVEETSKEIFKRMNEHEKEKKKED